MKANLSTSGYFYGQRWHEEDRARLGRLGFTFKEHDPGEDGIRFTGHTYPELAIQGSPTIEIATLEDLVAFVREHGRIVLEVCDGDDGPGLDIEIYDDHRE